MQIGWATIQTPFTNEEGTGDTPDSFAYDGYRKLKWNGSQQKYGEEWHSGIIIRIKQQGILLAAILI